MNFDDLIALLESLDIAWVTEADTPFTQRVAVFDGRVSIEQSRRVVLRPPAVPGHDRPRTPRHARRHPAAVALVGGGAARDSEGRVILRRGS